MVDYNILSFCQVLFHKRPSARDQDMNLDLGMQCELVLDMKFFSVDVEGTPKLEWQPRQCGACDRNFCNINNPNDHDREEGNTKVKKE